MAIFHLSIRPTQRIKGYSAVAQVAYNAHSKLTEEPPYQKHNWSKYKQDLIEPQVIGPKITSAQLAAGRKIAEK